jgi:hypothetical protein
MKPVQCTICCSSVYVLSLPGCNLVSEGFYQLPNSAEFKYAWYVQAQFFQYTPRRQ